MAAALGSLLLVSCTGIFQKSLPKEPARYEWSSLGELSVGAAEADITPENEQYLGGFDLNRVSTGIHSRLKARVMVIKVGSGKIALIGLDNLGLQREDVDWIKSGLYGFANGNVFIASSHTHAAPDLVGLWGYYGLSSGRDREYLALVRRGIMAAVKAAEADLRPARMRLGSADLPREGLVRNTNKDGVFDRKFTVLQAVERDTEKPIASLLHMGCHPEVFRRSNSEISADFVGELCDQWRAAGHGQAVFINGALGAMVTPKLHRAEGIVKMGAALLQLGEEALASAKPISVPDMEVHRRDVYLPMRSFGLSGARLLMLIPRNVYDGHLRSTVGYLRLGELEVATLPGETEPGLAQRLRSDSHRPNLLIFSLVDDEVGYLMSERDARDPEFEYERSMSPGVDAGEKVLSALVGR